MKNKLPENNSPDTIASSPVRNLREKMFSPLIVLLLVCLINDAVHCWDVPIMMDLPSEVLYRVSQPTALECAVEGSADNVKYTWQKDGKSFNWKDLDIAQFKHKGTLVFLSPRVEDEGRYQCFAESPAVVASSRIVNFKRAYIVAPNITIETVEPIRGRSLKLDCPKPDAYPEPTIVWERRLISKPDIAYSVYSSRGTVSDQGDLYFSKIVSDDILEFFKYVCVAKSPAAWSGITLAEYYMPYFANEALRVDDSPDPQYVSSDLVGKVGEPTEIYCVSSVQYPRWFKNDQRIEENPQNRITPDTHASGRMLLINTTILEDEGTYSCEYNAKGKPTKKYTIKLKVVSAPKLKAVPPKIITAKLDHDVTIPFIMTGVPKPTVTWTYNAKPLANSRVSVTDDGLSVRSVTKQDGGYYGCRATNENGEEYSEVYLLVE